MLSFESVMLFLGKGVSWVGCIRFGVGNGVRVFGFFCVLLEGWEF